MQTHCLPEHQASQFFGGETTAALLLSESMQTELGFRLPVWMSRAVFEQYIDWSDDDNRRKRTCQDMEGRLWDVVYMARLAAQNHAESKGADYSVYVVPRPGKARSPRPVQLRISIQQELDSPHFFIGLPWED